MITVFLVSLAVMYVVNIINTILLTGKPRRILTARLAAVIVGVNLAVVAGIIATILES